MPDGMPHRGTSGSECIAWVPPETAQRNKTDTVLYSKAPEKKGKVLGVEKQDALRVGGGGGGLS